jgi:hypothetical protein
MNQRYLARLRVTQLQPHAVKTINQIPIHKQLASRTDIDRLFGFGRDSMSGERKKQRKDLAKFVFHLCLLAMAPAHW